MDNESMVYYRKYHITLAKFVGRCIKYAFMIIELINSLVEFFQQFFNHMTKSLRGLILTRHFSTIFP